MVAINDINKFLALFNQLMKIEGAINNLSGVLFEFIVCHVYNEIYQCNIDISKHITVDAKRREIDVYVKTRTGKIYFIECKGYKSPVSQNEASEWVDKTKLLRKWAIENHKDFSNYEYIYQYITTSDYIEDAKKVFEEANKKSKNIKISYLNGKEFLKLIQNNRLSSKPRIIEVLNAYYFKQSLKL